MNIDVINSHKRRPANVPKNAASPEHQAALDALLSTLERWETSDDAIGRCYRGLMAEADERVVAKATPVG